MKKILLTFVLIPISALGQECDLGCQIIRQELGLPLPQPAPVYGLPVQPVLPVPQDKGPMGTGYSIVTTTREKRNIFDADLTGQETVQRVVPNDINGNPMRGYQYGW